MLILKKPTIEDKGSWCIVKTLLCDENSSKELFFAIENCEKQMLRKDSAPFLLWATLIAMKEKEDLLIEGAIDSRLLYGITQILLPAFEKMGWKKTPVIQAQEIAEYKQENPAKGVATGLSGGVDSFYTVVSHLDERLKLTHLVQFFPDMKIKDIGETVSFKNHNLLDCWNNGVKEKLGLPIIKVFSNFVEYCTFAFEQIHAFCNVSHALLLNGVIKTYLYSTGFSMDETKLDFSDTSHYELLISQVVNSSSFEMVSYLPVVNRIEKTMFISKNEVVQKYLHVCVKRQIGEGNCTQCFKCKRTLATLDVIGKINQFTSSFDIPLYEKNKRKIWGELLYRKRIMKDSFAKEIICEAKKQKYKKPVGAFCAMIGVGIRNQINKLKKD